MKKLLLYTALIPFQIWVYKCLGESSFFIDYLFIPIYQLYQSIVGGISNLLPFSFGDIVYFLVGIILIRYFFHLIKSLLNRNWKSVQDNLKKGLKYLNFFILYYFLVWGFMYDYKKFDSLVEDKDIQAAELKSMVIQYDSICKSLREILDESPSGVMQFTTSDQAFSQEISLDYHSIPEAYKKLPNTYSTRIKKSLYSPFLVYNGIGGYFNPFTQECQYISIVSDYKKPLIESHEIAHKFGYAKENEANFAAFLFGENSKNKALKYSVYFSALRHLLYDIAPQDTVFVQSIKDNWSAGMKRDIEADKVLQKQYESQFMESIFYSFNDVFLQFNRQEGMVSYHRYVRLLVVYERRRNAKKHK